RAHQDLKAILRNLGKIPRTATTPPAGGAAWPSSRSRRSAAVEPSGSGRVPPRRRQKEDLFLDIGSQQEEVHDLRDPRAAHVTESGQRAIVGELLLAQESLET